MRRILPIMLLLFVFLVPLTSKGKSESIEIPHKFSIIYPEGEDEILLDPFSAADEMSLMVLEGLYEGLFRFDEETGNPVNGYAREVTVSDDALTYTFTLREGSTFSNQDPITSQTFVDSWLHLLEVSGPGSQKSSLVSLFDVVSGARNYRLYGTNRERVGITASSPYELTITLDSPAPYLTNLLATTPFSAVHLDQFNGSGQIISSGAFTLVSSSQESVLLRKNDHYYDKDEVGTEYIEILRLSQEESVQSYNERGGEWYNVYIPLDQLRNRDDLSIDPIYSTGFYYFSRDEGPYSDPKVRKALSMITPWNTLRETSGQPFPSSSLIPFSRHGGEEEQGTIEDATSLIREAGYEIASLPPLTIAIHRGSTLAESARLIAEHYSEVLGITVIIDTVPLSLYTRYPNANPYDLSYITWVADFHDPIVFLNLFYSKSAYNIANYRSNAYDELLEGALFADDPVEREVFLDAAHRFILSDAVAFPLYTGFSLNVVDSERVRGWYPNDLNIHPLRALREIP